MTTEQRQILRVIKGQPVKAPNSRWYFVTVRRGNKARRAARLEDGSVLFLCGAPTR